MQNTQDFEVNIAHKKQIKAARELKFRGLEKDIVIKQVRQTVKVLLKKARESNTVKTMLSKSR